MGKKIVKKKYYKVTFELASPLVVGSGDNQYTDKDIIRNSKGNPYIPGSAVAGICRSLFEEDEALINEYFGMIYQAKSDETDRTKEEAKESRIIFYDANMDSESISQYHISKRDSVALDEYKTAKEGAKFDMEILEPGVKFVTYIEQNFYGNDRMVTDEIADAWLENNIYIGAKTMRGYGSVKNVAIETKLFDLNRKEEVEKWLDFDMYAILAWKDSVSYIKKNKTEKETNSLELKLRQEGGISIRRYTTQICVDSKESLPDYEQLTVRKVSEGEVEQILPVIPGTSWAGAFRHRMLELVPDLEAKTYFGCVDEKKNEKRKSKIRFGETQLEHAQEKVLSRNSIDRFSGGTINTALFTEKTYYGGVTTLKICVEEKMDEKIKKALAATIADLNYGLLSVGGLAAIGRGCFKVTEINGNAVKEDNEVYAMVLEQLGKKEEK